MNSERYSRQGMVPEFSGEGQQTLEDASVLIIGASSIGSTLMYNLASAGIGTIGVADHNIVGTSNLNAPIHFEEDLGTLKVISATRKLKAYNSLINVIPHATAINKDNVYEIVSQYDIIVLAVNNPQTAMLVNEACVELDKPFVTGKTNGFIGTAGFVLPHETPCLACFYGEEMPPEDNSHVHLGPAVSAGRPGRHEGQAVHLQLCKRHHRQDRPDPPSRLRGLRREGRRR